MGEPSERRGGDGAWVLREGTASLVGAPQQSVWYRHVLVRRPGDRASALLATVDGQLQLLAEIGGRPGLPTLVAGRLTEAEGILLTTLPAGRTWREMFGPPASGRTRAHPVSARPAPSGGAMPMVRSTSPARMAPPSRSTAIALLQAAAGAGDVLARLHESGYSHRAMTPDTVVLPPVTRYRPVATRPASAVLATAATTATPDPLGAPDILGAPDTTVVPGTAAALRDLGLAAVLRRAGEGPAEYRAPEQERLGLPGPRLGPLTDTFRLAAMAYHCLAGFVPARGGPAPLRGCRLPFAVPQTLDEVLLRSLDVDPARRPARIRVLADAFRLGAFRLAHNGR